MLLFQVIDHIHIITTRTRIHTHIRTGHIDRIKKAQIRPRVDLRFFLLDALLFFHSVDFFFQIIMFCTAPWFHTGDV